MSAKDASTNLAEDSLEYKVPKMTVNIVRRKSCNNDNESSGYKPLWLLGSHESKNIPKIEVSYQSLHEKELKFKLNAVSGEARNKTPTLRMHYQFDSRKRSRKVNNRELPLISNQKQTAKQDFYIAGQSVKGYDWISSFLNSHYLKNIEYYDMLYNKSKTPSRREQLRSKPQKKLSKTDNYKKRSDEY